VSFDLQKEREQAPALTLFLEELLNEANSIGKVRLVAREFVCWTSQLTRNGRTVVRECA